MSNDDVEKQKAELETLGRRIDHYAQSRSLGLVMLLALIATNFILLAGAIELVRWKPKAWWSYLILFSSTAWVSIGTLWLAFKLATKYGYSFYKKDGQIELQKEKISILATVVYIGAVICAAILSQIGAMPVRWALTLTLTSLGIFIFYAGQKEKEKVIGTTWSVLLLLEAGLITIGTPMPFAGTDWIYSYCAASGIYVIGSGLVTAVLVHMYNRAILHKIKQMRPSGEQQTNKSDT